MTTHYEAVPGIAQRNKVDGNRVRGRVRCLRDERTCFGVWKVPVQIDGDAWIATGEPQLHAEGASAWGPMLVTEAFVDFGRSANPDGVAFFFICNRQHASEFASGPLRLLSLFFSRIEPTEPSQPNVAEVRALIEAAVAARDCGQPLTP